MGFFKNLEKIFPAAKPKKCPKCGSENINNEVVPYDGVEDENTHSQDLVLSGKDECQDCGHVF